MARRKIHLSLDVRGALMQSDRDLTPLAKSTTVEGRRLRTGKEMRAFLLDCLAEGYEYLPMTECDNFDPKKGCLGHPITEEAEHGKG